MYKLVTSQWCLVVSVYHFLSQETDQAEDPSQESSVTVNTEPVVVETQQQHAESDDGAGSLSDLDDDALAENLLLLLLLLLLCFF